MISETCRCESCSYYVKTKWKTFSQFIRSCFVLKSVSNASPHKIVACSNHNLYMQVTVKLLKLWGTNPQSIWARISVPRTTALTRIYGGFCHSFLEMMLFLLQRFYGIE
jgi:hypothetical protein